ncbi:MAG: peroxiredoxin [Candidatus Absconditabacterales bacterium]|nr:peroxiredoxin [Candidatus Absconditabacterales bacterium]
MENQRTLPLIGEMAPAFKAQSTAGPINFPEDYKGKRVVLFSHPADFTPVCTTEFIGFQNAYQDFKAINTELLGYSVDGIQGHIEWLRNIEKNFGVKVEFPLLAGSQIAHLYGMLHPSADDSATVRAVFVINPEGKISAIMYYPLSNGRSVAEVLRLVKSLQTTAKYKRATPENRPNNPIFGDKVIVPPASTMEDAIANPQKYENKDWYICTEENPNK